MWLLCLVFHYLSIISHSKLHLNFCIIQLDTNNKFILLFNLVNLEHQHHSIIHILFCLNLTFYMQNLLYIFLLEYSKLM